MFRVPKHLALKMVIKGDYVLQKTSKIFYKTQF